MRLLNADLSRWVVCEINKTPFRLDTEGDRPGEVVSDMAARTSVLDSLVSASRRVCSKCLSPLALCTHHRERVLRLSRWPLNDSSTARIRASASRRAAALSMLARSCFRLVVNRA